MAIPILDKEYEERKKQAKELISAGGCAAIKYWSNTDAFRLCPSKYKDEVKFDPLEGMVYISEWLDTAKKAIEFISKGIELIEPKPTPSTNNQREGEKEVHPIFKGWNSEKLIGRVRLRFQELIRKKWDWRSFYNGWIEGRADMLQVQRQDYDNAQPTETPSMPVEEVPAKRIIPKDPYFVGQCNSCGYKCSSEEWGGGSAIADTGDYTDPYCPLCLSKDVDEADDDLYIDQTELLIAAVKRLQEKVNCLDFEGYTRDNQIGNKDCKIGELQAELSSLRTQLSDTKRELERQASLKNSALATIEDQKRRNTSLESQLSEAQNDRDAYKNQAAELREWIVRQAHKSQDNA